MNLKEYCERIDAEKIMVSKELRKIKGKKPNYQKPWVKFLKKAHGSYIALPQ